jgi:pyruvate dehydrogenase E2 component (dihydrolipoamide acetyltransferase)
MKEMVTEVIMPKMGQTMEKGKIVKWLKKEGEKVRKGEPLLEIETDKTTIEVEAREAGILRKILTEDGEEASVATKIAYITKEGEILKEESAQPKKIDRVKASPLAKKLAREKNVDLSLVIGTGPRGRITKEDVLKHVKIEATTPDASLEQKKAEFQIMPLSNMRSAIARKMAESNSNIPHFYATSQVDMTETVKMRKNMLQTIEVKTGIRLSYTHLIVKAIAMALEEYPQLNSTFEEENIKQWKDINIGIAVNLKDGLIVPVLRRANKLNLLEIVAEINSLIDRAREKRLREDEFSGGTFTISNMGALDVESFIAIINVPETAILAIGRISDKPAVIEGHIEIRKIMNITLSADHRVIDGVIAARFLKKVKILLEAPYSITL